MSIEVNPSSRVQVRGVASLRHPGHCALCGSAELSRVFVDPSIFFDYEGQIYFCDFCVKEMAKAIGCLTPEDNQFIQNVNNELAVRNLKLEQVRINHERLITALSDAGFVIPSDVGLVDLTGEDDNRSKQKSRESELVDDKPTIDRVEQVAESIKSTAERGHNDSSRNASSDTDGDSTSVPTFRL